MLAAATASAQRTVEFVIPFAQGGTADKLALILLGPMKNELAQVGFTPVLTYKPGAGSAIAANYVAKSTNIHILMAPNAIVTSPIVNRSAATYNLETDFTVLEYLGYPSMFLVVNANSDIQTVNDLQKLCQSKPITYGSGGIGTSTHLTGSIVMSALKCKATHVPYKGSGPAMVDLQGNHIITLVDFEPSVRQYIDAKIFRPLLVVDQKRNQDFANLPSMSDIGMPGYDFYNWFVLAVNSSASEDDIAKIRLSLNRVVQNQDVRQHLREAGLRNIGAKISKNFLSQESTKFSKIIDKVSINGQF